jgi:hypothetical protein
MMDFISALEHIMRWVVITALGVPTEPDVKRNLAMVSGVRALNAALTAVSSAPVFSISTKGSVPAWETLRLPATTTASCRWATALIAGMKRSMVSAKITPGRSSSTLALSLAKSLDSRELPGDTGLIGTPACRQASISRACSMPLSDSTSTGRSGESFCPSSQVAMR